MPNNICFDFIIFITNDKILLFLKIVYIKTIQNLGKYASFNVYLYTIHLRIETSICFPL